MSYVPGSGDVVWLDFNPQAGHEQAGRRPALVLSPRDYNRKVGLALFCPITKKIKGYPFEVSLPKAEEVSGVILSDQVKSLDWQKRNITFIGSASKRTVNEVMAKLRVLLPDV